MTTKRQRDAERIDKQRALLAMRRKDLTPYDTGKRAEPKVWEERHREGDDDYGKVDFDNEESATVATLYIEREEDGSYTLKGYANEALKIEIESNDPTDDTVRITMAGFTDVKYDEDDNPKEDEDRCPESEDGRHQVTSGSCDLCGQKNFN